MKVRDIPLKENSIRGVLLAEQSPRVQERALLARADWAAYRLIPQDIELYELILHFHVHNTRHMKTVHSLHVLSAEKWQFVRQSSGGCYRNGTE